MPDADAVEDDAQEAAALPIPNGAADHGGGDHHGSSGEQNGIAEQNGPSREGNSGAAAPADKPLTFLDHEVRASAQELGWVGRKSWRHRQGEACRRCCCSMARTGTVHISSGWLSAPPG